MTDPKETLDAAWGALANSVHLRLKLGQICQPEYNLELMLGLIVIMARTTHADDAERLCGIAANLRDLWPIYSTLEPLDLGAAFGTIAAQPSSKSDVGKQRAQDCGDMAEWILHVFGPHKDRSRELTPADLRRWETTWNKAVDFLSARDSARVDLSYSHVREELLFGRLASGMVES